jgi:bifunctional UDP-N-acetylglucosamine pyrophosphorylase / glucosamine-1-phosphate N-acetyltransferase
VVDSPERVLAEILPDGVNLAVQEQANGTGGAVEAGIAGIDSAIASGLGPPGSELDPEAVLVVLSADVPLFGAGAIRNLVEAHAASGAAATIVTAVVEDPRGYGRVVRDGSGRVERVVETKREGDSTAEERQIREVNAGVYAFQAGALVRALPRLTADNAQGELYLPQVLDLLTAEGEAIAAHSIKDPASVFGVNDRVALADVRRIVQQGIHERHMRAGVSIVDPLATVIDVDVQIGQDSVIEPFTTIKGTTRIGERCTVRHSYLVDCVLEDGVSVGPFAYLRPGTVLHDNAKAGTFVEVKNSEIGAGTKIPHLSYIGDADVGEQVNLGAATITANYDGRRKHRTRVGSRVRTSVDTTLVAPVAVGDDAYTGAGSVITDDVPPGALAVARARQENIEGYAERRKD